MDHLPGMDASVAWGDPTQPLPDWRKAAPTQADLDDDDDELTPAHEALICAYLGFDPDELDQDDDVADDEPTAVVADDDLEEDRIDQAHMPPLMPDYAPKEPDYQDWTQDTPPTPPVSRRQDDDAAIERRVTSPKDLATNEPYYQLGESVVYPTASFDAVLHLRRGPNPPGPGWVLDHVGARGGRYWRHDPEQAAALAAAATPSAPTSSAPSAPDAPKAEVTVTKTLGADLPERPRETVPITVTRNDDSTFKTSFQVADTPYEFLARERYYDNGYSEPEFAEHQDAFFGSGSKYAKERYWDVEFMDRTPTSYRTFDAGPREGVNPFNVIRAVRQSMLQFIREKQPKNIRFQSVKEDVSRQKLYDHFALELQRRFGYDFKKTDVGWAYNYDFVLPAEKRITESLFAEDWLWEDSYVWLLESGQLNTLLEDISPVVQGYTGVITDSLGRKYHFVNGRRVSAAEHDEHVKQGNHSQEYTHESPLEDEQANHMAWTLATRTAARAFRQIEPRLRDPDGGFSVSPITGNEPKGGFAVSIFPQRSFMKPAKQLQLKDLVRYYLANKELLKDHRVYLGGWHDPKTDNVFLDLSVLVKDEEEARKLAKEHDQLAYFDFKHLRSVEVNPNATSGGTVPAEKKDGWNAMQATAQKPKQHEFREIHAHIGHDDVTVYQNPSKQQLANILRNTRAQDYALRGYVNKYTGDAYVWETSYGAHDDVAAELRTGIPDNNARFYISAIDGQPQIAGYDRGGPADKWAKENGIAIHESLEHGQRQDQTHHAGRPHAGELVQDVQGAHRQGADRRGIGRGQDDAQGRRGGRAGEETLTREQRFVLEQAAHFAATLFIEPDYDDLPEFTIRALRLLEAAAQPQVLQAGQPKPPGFTGVVVGKDKHKYYYVNGQRVSHGKHESAVKGGAQSQMLQYEGKLRHKMKHADALVAKVHAQMQAKHQADQEAQAKEQQEKADAERNAGFAHKAVVKMGNIAKRMLGMKSPKDAGERAAKLAALTKGAIKGGGEDVKEKQGLLVAEMATTFVEEGAADMVKSVQVLSLDRFKQLKKRYGTTGALVSMGAAVGTFAAVAAMHTEIPGAPLIAASVTYGLSAAIHGVFGKKHEAEKAPEPQESQEPQTGPGGGTRSLRRQKSDEMRQATPHDVMAKLHGPTPPEVASKLKVASDKLKQLVHHSAHHVAHEALEKHSEVLAELAEDLAKHVGAEALGLASHGIANLSAYKIKEMAHEMGWKNAVAASALAAGAMSATAVAVGEHAGVVGHVAPLMASIATYAALRGIHAVMERYTDKKAAKAKEQAEAKKKHNEERQQYLRSQELMSRRHAKGDVRPNEAPLLGDEGV